MNLSFFPLGLGACCLSSLAMAQGALENPQPDAFESGIGIISGWHCVGPKVEIEFLTPTNFPNGKTLFDAAYGTFRGDTQSICGDTNNGFAMLINFNNLGQGTHTLRAFAFTKPNAANVKDPASTAPGGAAARPNATKRPRASKSPRATNPGVMSSRVRVMGQ